MDQLKIIGEQEIMGISIPIVEGGFGEDQKVMLAKTIAEIHEQPLKKVNQLINENIDEFEEGIDIIDLKNNGDKHILHKMGFSNRDISISKKIYILSEQGYIKLYSIFRNKDEKILKNVMRSIFQSNKEIVGFAYNKEIRFREILGDILRENNIKTIFQHNVDNYKIDLFLPELNIAIEYDENNHNNYTYKEHLGRQAYIEEKLNCNFIRITDNYSIGVAIGKVLKSIEKFSNNKKLQGEI